MYKRPTPRTWKPRTQFVTEARPNGASVSYWTPVATQCIVPTGAPGRVGEILDKMRLGSDAVKRPYQRVWTPPIDYKFIAQTMPENQREAYIKKCEAWFEEHPPVTRVAPSEAKTYNTELIAKMFSKYCPRVPPIDVRVAVYREAGCSEEYITKAIERDAMLEATSEERQKTLDAIFAKWPAANKTDPKPKGKVIKAVKKRIKE